MLDGVCFEELGKPAVVVATTSFVRLATSIKNSMNLGDLPLVVVPHPLGAEPAAAEKARRASSEIIRAVSQSS